MEATKNNVEASFIKPKAHGFLEDLIQLCNKHNISIHPDADTKDTVVTFHDWETFSCLEACNKVASLYWPRIQTEIIVRRKNEQRKSKEDC
ncbi:MAG: hypothetical protein IMF19_04635 [Proteobacteria bacterium]|nr:hypothetical protein [Pseudomonadota bacterium]